MVFVFSQVINRVIIAPLWNVVFCKIIASPQFVRLLAGWVTKVKGVSSVHWCPLVSTALVSIAGPLKQRNWNKPDKSDQQ